MATQLGKTLYDKGIEIVQVYSRNLGHANKLAEALNCEGINHLEYLKTDADLYLFSLKDDAYLEVLKNWKLSGVNMAHTSGSLDANIFKGYSDAYAVFYPFQSFTSGRNINWEELPFFVNASDERLHESLSQLGKKVGGTVVHLDHQQRKIYHLAAVFANNFVNRLFHISQEICEAEDLDFDLMRPLIKETAEKVMDNLPSDVQTGPASRVDLEVLNMHFSALSGDPDKQKVYQILSESIIKARKDHD